MKTKSKIEALAVTTGEGFAKYLDPALNVLEIRFDGKPPEFEIIQHPTLEVESLEPLVLKHRKA